MKNIKHNRFLSQFLLGVKQKYKTDKIDEVKQMTDKQLLLIPGIGPIAVRRFRHIVGLHKPPIPTRMFCDICGQIHKIDYEVPKDIWEEVIRVQFQKARVCLNCFMARADERFIEWEKDIKFFPCSASTQLKIQNELTTYENRKNF